MDHSSWKKGEDDVFMTEHLQFELLAEFPIQLFALCVATRNYLNLDTKILMPYHETGHYNNIVLRNLVNRLASETYNFG